MPLIPLLVAHLARPIHELYGLHPFVHGQLVLARKVVYVLDQTTHQLARAGTGLWAHGADSFSTLSPIVAVTHLTTWLQ